VADLEWAGQAGNRRPEPLDEIALDLDALRSLSADSGQRHARRRQLVEMLEGQAATLWHPAADVRQRDERVCEFWTRLVDDRQRQGLGLPAWTPSRPRCGSSPSGGMGRLLGWSTREVTP
jgi:hypothetical protein